MEVRSGFKDNIGCFVSDGSSTLFWWDPCLEGGTLKDRFKKLLELAENKMLTVAEMSCYDGEWRGIDNVGYFPKRKIKWESFVLC
jgi:hypothetical protein